MKSTEIAEKYGVPIFELHNYIDNNATFSFKKNWWGDIYYLPDDVDIESFIQPFLKEKEEIANRKLAAKLEAETQKQAEQQRIQDEQEKARQEKEALERKQREELLHIANHDPLTGLINRRRLWEHLYSFEIEKVEKDIDFVISIFDIDYFKRVNDTYGHDCGDFVLVEVSKLIKENLLKNVKIGRWGGEEFLLLYRGYSNEEVIEDLERLRALVDNRIFDYLGTKIHITITLGVSSSTYCDSAEHVIADADKQLMKGKIQGKNRVVARNIQKGLSENDAIFDSFIDSSHKD
jgi:diguanylate cyclase (GGDEF)-like protein